MLQFASYIKKFRISKIFYSIKIEYIKIEKKKRKIYQILFANTLPMEKNSITYSANIRK